MSNFQQYTGDARTYSAYPMRDSSTGVTRAVVSGDICDFDVNAVPTDGRWASHAGPATVTLDPSVNVPPVAQLPVTAAVYNPGTGAPTSGSYTAGQECRDSTGAEFVCTVSGTPGTWVSVSASGGSFAQAIAPTAVKTANYTAAAGDMVPFDLTSGSLVLTLPTAPADKTRVAVKIVTQPGTNTVTINCGGSDVINKAGTTSGTISLLNQLVQFQYRASGAVWYVVGGDLPLSQLDLRFMKLPASPTDGQLAAWNNSTGLWVPTNPTGNSELAYAENATGTVTTIGSGATVDIPSSTVVVPASSRPVYLSATAVFTPSSTGGSPSTANLFLVEVSNGVDTAITWYCLHPMTAQVSGNATTLGIAPRRLASSTARTRTFKLQGATFGIAGAIQNANGGVGYATWIAAEAR